MSVHFRNDMVNCQVLVNSTRNTNVRSIFYHVIVFLMSITLCFKGKLNRSRFVGHHYSEIFFQVPLRLFSIKSTVNGGYDRFAFDKSYVLVATKHELSVKRKHLPIFVDNIGLFTGHNNFLLHLWHCICEFFME